MLKNVKPISRLGLHIGTQKCPTQFSGACSVHRISALIRRCFHENLIYRNLSLFQGKTLMRTNKK